jgi:hypothetical protein
MLWKKKSKYKRILDYLTISYTILVNILLGGVVTKQLNQITNRYLFIDLFEFYKEAISHSNCSQESRDITLATIASSALHSLEAILDLSISGTNLFKGFNSTSEVYGIFPDDDDHNQSSDRRKSIYDYLNTFIGTFIYNSVWESTLQLQVFIITLYYIIFNSLHIYLS